MQLAYIEQCNKSKIMPQPLGIVSRRGNNKYINSSLYMINKDYAKAYGEGLKHSKVPVVNISENLLDGESCLQILKGLPKNVEILDMSKNRPNKMAILKLQSIFADKDYKNLKILKLEDMGLNDKMLQLLVQDGLAIQAKLKLEEISFAKNEISDDGVEFIIEMIEVNTGIKKLSLHWNKLKYKGGNKIAEFLKDNRQIKILDLSWNSIGQA